MSIRTISQFVPADPADRIGDAEAFAAARARLSAAFREYGETMVTDPEVTGDLPVPVRVTADGTDVVQVGPGEPHDGHLITWLARGRTAPIEALLDGAPVSGGYVAQVPASHTEFGGPVRVRHRLGGAVLVSAHRADGAPIGYLFAQELTPDEVAVELLPGATAIRCIPDEDT